MFKVKSKATGKVYTVYGISGISFIVFDEGTWNYIDMDRVVPVEA